MRYYYKRKQQQHLQRWPFCFGGKPVGQWQRRRERARCKQTLSHQLSTIIIIENNNNNNKNTCSGGHLFWWENSWPMAAREGEGPMKTNNLSSAEHVHLVKIENNNKNTCSGGHSVLAGNRSANGSVGGRGPDANKHLVTS